MFTGLIEEIGIINKIDINNKFAVMKINAEKVIKEIKMGDSINTNGVCLTVIDFNELNFSVEIMGETLRRTNLGLLKSGDRVNLERAMSVNDRFGGHIVSGHVDGIGRIYKVEREDKAVWFTITADKEVLRYVVEKGSICIDGISLTVTYVDNRYFKVSIIPHTLKETILLDKKLGDMVNLECDIVGKYIEKFIKIGKKEDISIKFLQENGFY